MSDRTAVITQDIFISLIVFWPLIDARVREKRPNSEASVWIGAGAVGFLLFLTVWEAMYLLH